MSIATETDVQKLIEKYGPHVQAQPGLACYQNAIQAALEIVIQSRARYIPQIFSVNFPSDHHVYLVHRKKVYNSGVTWPDSKYPDYTFDSLQRHGQDESEMVYGSALSELEDPRAPKILDLITLPIISRYPKRLLTAALAAAYLPPR
jgi:hypothetical protein